LTIFLIAGEFFVSCRCVANADSLNIVWRSKAASRDALALDFGSLYGALDRLYLLGVHFNTKQVSPSGRSLQQVLIDEHQYVGTFLAPEVPRLLCELNSKICSRSTQTGEPKWTSSDNEPLVIPAIDFESLWTPEYYSAKRGDTIEGIVLKDRQGCVRLDPQCKEILRNLNPEKGDVVENPNGRIVVPTLNYFAEVKLRGINLPIFSDKSADALKELDILRTSPDEPTKVRAEALFSAVKPVVPNIVGVSGASSNTALNAPVSPNLSSADKPAYEAALVRRRAIFKSVGADGWDPAKELAPLWVDVALIDGRIDDKHCDFYPGQVQRSIFFPGANSNKPEEDKPRGECDLLLVSIPSVSIHGTHVAGILSAKADSRIGPGMYPFTTIHSYELDLGDAKIFLQSMAALFAQILHDRVKVLNMSTKYVKTLEKLGDPFEDLMLRAAGPITQQLLVVAAAGNEGLTIGATDQDCPPRPACFSTKYRNVISVIAIDDNLMAPAPANFNSNDSSNWGEHFDIAAPGLRVPSAAPLNQVAELDGTSQAAPIVSGAAAHLYALRPAALPGEIKNRLIWTSDLLPSLSKKVFGGRLNVSTATNNLNSDVFRMSDGSTVIGVVLKKERYVVNVKDKETAEALPINLSRIRRMARRSDGTWDILWLSGDDRDAPLLRRRFTVSGVKYRDEEDGTFYQSDAIAIQNSDDIKPSNILDYISSMK